MEAPSTLSASLATTIGPVEVQTKRYYRPELDLLRFFAFFLVYIHHVLPRVPEQYPKSLPRLQVELLVSIANLGGYGLCLFFFLSAFLIGELLHREKSNTGTVHIRAFYLRRILRIWPLYLLGIAIGLTYSIYRHEPADIWRMLSYLTFFGNWFTVAFGWSPNIMTHLWSISVEEQFYLFYPSLAKTLSLRGIAMASASLIAIANIWMYFLGRSHVELDHAIWSNSFVQFQMFGGGLLLMIVLGGRARELRSAARVFISGLGLVAWGIATFFLKAKTFEPASSGAQVIAGYALALLGCACLLYASLGYSIPRKLSFLVYLGKISFGLYVFHLLGLLIAQKLRPWVSLPIPWLALHAIMGFIITLALAALSYRYLKTPFLKLKSRFEWIASRPITS